mmetsp:Transcript_17663/g.19127  ORF Transcript_17663/g.19127 Transcript_17663/m.19127 type:complete len:172 (-) Transcript_17663:259-774(-)
MNSSKNQLIRIFLFIFVTICFSCSKNNFVDAGSNTNNDNEDPKKIIERWISQARNQYETLPDQGKFASGAVLGFGASKVAVNSAVKFVKIAGAAFIATEVLEAAGILDMDKAFDSAGIEKESIKRKALSKVSDIRKSVRDKFDGENIKKWIKTDKMGAFGAATGAFIGFLF